MAFSRNISKASLGLGIEYRIETLMLQQGKKRKGVEDSLQWAIRHSFPDAFEYFLYQDNGMEKAITSHWIASEIADKNALWALKMLVANSPNRASVKLLTKVIVRNNTGMLLYLIEKWKPVYLSNPRFKKEFIMSLANQEVHRTLKPWIMEELKHFLSESQISMMLEFRNAKFKTGRNQENLKEIIELCILNEEIAI